MIACEQKVHRNYRNILLFSYYKECLQEHLCFYRHFGLLFTKRSINASPRSHPFLSGDIRKGNHGRSWASLERFLQIRWDKWSASPLHYRKKQVFKEQPFFNVLSSFYMQGNWIFGTRWMSCQSVYSLLLASFDASKMIRYDDTWIREASWWLYWSWTVCHGVWGRSWTVCGYLIRIHNSLHLMLTFLISTTWSLLVYQVVDISFVTSSLKVITTCLKCKSCCIKCISFLCAKWPWFHAPLGIPPRLCICYLLKNELI